MSYENILEGKLFHTKSTNIPSEGETTKHTIQQNLKHWWWDTPTKIVCCTCWWILRANNSSFLSNLIFFSRTQLSRCEALNNPQVNRVAFLRCCKDSENHRSFSADVRGSRISQLCEIRKHKRGHHRLGKKIKFQEIFLLSISTFCTEYDKASKACEWWGKNVVQYPSVQLLVSRKRQLEICSQFIRTIDQHRQKWINHQRSQRQKINGGRECDVPSCS